MKTKNARELAQILSFITSEDIESVKLGISLFATHYLVTQLPKYKKFKVSLKYPGWKSTQWCRGTNTEKTFCKNQFIKMLNSNVVPIHEKTCAILNFVHSKVNKLKNPYYNGSLASCLWGSSLDHISIDDVRSSTCCHWKITSSPISKKKLNRINLTSDQTKMEFIDELDEYAVETRWPISPLEINENYKTFLIKKFRKKNIITQLKNIAKLDPEIRMHLKDISEWLSKYSNY